MKEWKVERKEGKLKRNGERKEEGRKGRKEGEI